jgi:hypothetical protein
MWVSLKCPVPRKIKNLSPSPWDFHSLSFCVYACVSGGGVDSVFCFVLFLRENDLASQDENYFDWVFVLATEIKRTGIIGDFFPVLKIDFRNLMIVKQD